MSHRNSDNNNSWSRNARNSDGVGAVGNGATGYKEHNWAVSHRYVPDARRKDRSRSYRGYSGRRSYDDRRGGHNFRNNSWSTSNGTLDANYGPHTRYANSWLPKLPDKFGTKTGNDSGRKEIVPPEFLIHQIPPLAINFVAESQSDNDDVITLPADPAANVGAEKIDRVTESDKPWSNDNFSGSIVDFDGFTDVGVSKMTNGNGLDSTPELDFNRRLSPTPDEKIEMTPQENELMKLIEDEALKMITDAEQPSCSTLSQINNSSNSNTPMGAAVVSSQNAERRIERSAEQVTRKLINQLTTMNKYSLKQMINNPDSKYETALKTHARQKLRAEVRRQLRNFSLSENNSQTKTACGMLEADESVDSDKIPDALLEQIGKVLDLNLLDLNVGEEPPVQVTAPVEEEECAINTSDADDPATEMLDKNLRLNDDDDQLDADDIFARAELFLMKGSESVRKCNSGANSPIDELFPNDQIESIVSEESGFEKSLEIIPDKVDDLLDEPLIPEFQCFLRVSTVEELNKKVNESSSTTPNEATESPAPIANIVEDTAPPPPPLANIIEDTVASSIAQDHSNDDVPAPLPVTEEIQADVVDDHSKSSALSASDTSNGTTDAAPLNIECETALVDNSVSKSLPLNSQANQNSPRNNEEQPVVEEPKTDKPPRSNASRSKLKSPVTIRAPTHPELAGRKSKGSKTYKPNLVAHEHVKRDSKSPAPSTRSSSASLKSPSVNSVNNVSSSSKVPPPKPVTGVDASKQSANPVKLNSKHNGNGTSNTDDRDKTQRKRDSNTKYSSSNSNSLMLSSNSTTYNSNSGNISDSINKSSNGESSSLPMELPPVASLVGHEPERVPQLVKVPFVREQTPGPSIPSKRKKKKKHNRKRDRSPDLGMMLECDLRISRPAVTRTPPLQSSRDITTFGLKKGIDFERDGKPARETRAKSVDPKLFCDSRRERDRDRNRDKSRTRDFDERKDCERDARREKHKEERREMEREERKDKEREAKREKELNKEKEVHTNGAQLDVIKNKSQTSPDAANVTPRECKKSPTSKGKAASEFAAKHSKDNREPKDGQKESGSEILKERDVARDPARENSKEKEPKPPMTMNETGLKEQAKESAPKECDLKEFIKESKSSPKESKESPERENRSNDKPSPAETVTEKPSTKRKKSLLRGPNLIKGRREIIEPEVACSPTKIRKDQVHQDATVVTTQERVSLNHQTGVFSVETPVPLLAEVTQKLRKESPLHETSVPLPLAAPALQPERRALINASTFAYRNASPRPWKSPGEKKLLPATPAMPILSSMSPPVVERLLPVRTQTPSPTPAATLPPPLPPPQVPQLQPTATAMLVEPHSYHSAGSPRMAQSDILTRLPLPSLSPLSLATQMTAFTPVMTLLNQMQEIDNKMSDFQRRKMQIDSEIMKLNSEKFQIDQNSMQLQNDRFLVLNALRAALVECELNTIAAVQAASPLVVSTASSVINGGSPSVTPNRRKRPEPEPSPVLEDNLPKTKRRKIIPSDADPPQPTPTLIASTPECSEPEEHPTPSGGSRNAERTIRKITKISGNSQILQLFQRRRLISEKSAEESQSEDNAPEKSAAEKPAPVKRRRTRTINSSELLEQRSSRLGRLRSDSSRSEKSVDLTGPQPGQGSEPTATENITATDSSVPTTTSPPSSSHTVLRKDKEIPLNSHRSFLTREFKIILNKLSVPDHGGGTHSNI